MHIRLILILFFIQSIHSQAQKDSSSINSRLEIQILVTLPDNDSGTVVTIIKENDLIKTIPSAEKAHHFSFEFNSKYSIIASKNGYGTKRVLVNTKIPKGRESRVFERVEIEISLLKETTLDAKNSEKVVGEIRYDSKLEDFSVFVGGFLKSESKKKQTHYKKAVEDYSKMIAQDPRNAKNYKQRGYFKRELKQFEEANIDFNLAIALDSTDADAYFNRAYNDQELKNDKRAMLDYSKAISLNPQYAEAYVNRGGLRNDLKDYEGAFLDLNKAIELSPNDPVAYYNRAWTRYYTGDTIGACDDWFKVKELGSDISKKELADHCK